MPARAADDEDACRRGTSCSLGDLRGTSREHRRRHERVLVSRAARARSRATCDLAGVEAAGRDREADLRRRERDGERRRGRPRPATSPVEASTPDGTSTATTGLPRALIRSISPRGVLARRLAEADAEQRVDDHVRLAEARRARSTTVTSRPASRSDARADAPVAAVVRRRRRRRVTTARPGSASSDDLARPPCPPAPSAPTTPVGASSAAPRLLRRESGSSTHRSGYSSRTTQTAAASSRECVIESSIRPAPIRSA